MRALFALALIGPCSPQAGTVSGFDPCGATGTWTAYCPSISTSCGDYPGNSYEFPILASVAAFGGEFVDGNGITWAFDPGTCTASVVQYTSSSTGSICAAAEAMHPPTIIFNGPGSYLDVPAVNPVTCQLCSPILQCPLENDSGACIDTGEECDPKFPEQCCTSACAGQGNGIDTVFLCQ